MNGKFTTTKTEIFLQQFSLPEFIINKQIYSSWAFNIDNSSESSSTHDMMIVQVRSS
jgi:hypothetical protein